MSVAEHTERSSAVLGGAALFLRRLRLEPGPPLAMLGLLALTCFLFAALPRLFNEVADDGLRYMVDRASVDGRNLRVVRTDRIGSLAVVDKRAKESARELPAVLSSAIDETTFVVRSPRYIFQPDSAATVVQGPRDPGAQPGLARFLRLRAQPGFERHVRVVAGRMPRSTRQHARPRVEQPLFQTASAFRPGQVNFVSWADRVPVLEVALSAPTARELRLRVGDQAVYVPDRTGSPFGGPETSFVRVAIRDAKPLVVKVVGLVAIADEQAPYWFGEEGLQTPNVQRTQDAERTFAFAHAFTSPGAYSNFLAATRSVPLTYEYRHAFDSGRFDAGQLSELQKAVAELETRNAAAGPLDPRLETGLGDIFERYAGARSQAETLLAVAAIGLFACALANVGLLAALWYSRRRTETGVSRVRGASPLQVLAGQVAEGVLIAAPAGLLGWLAAILLIQARGSSLSLWLALGLVVSTVVLLVATIAGVARRPIRSSERDDIVVARPSPRRLALEAAVAVAAAAGVYLLRRRGLESGTDEGFDPYLAAVPVLLGLACGIVALRLYPLPIIGLSRLVRRSRGLAVHLGLNRAARQPDISTAPLLVLVLALAIACFSAAMLSTLETGQGDAAWRAVGAEARIDGELTEIGAYLPEKLVSSLDKKGEIARAYVQDVNVGALEDETPMIAVELDAFERIVRGTPAQVRFPAELRNPPIPGLIPAVVSTDWPEAGTFEIRLPRTKVNTIVVGNRDSFPGVPAGTPFAIVPYSALKETEAEGEIVRPNRLYVGGIDSGAIRAEVAELAPRADVFTRADVVDRLRQSPLVDNVLRGFRWAIVLAVLYAAIAVGLMALIAARSRARDLALVRTMGASQRDVFALAAIEVAPFVLTALVLGVALGVAIPYLIEPGLDLGFFTGAGTAPIVIPWGTLAAAAGVLLALVAATVAVAAVQARRAGLGSVLRIGER